MKSSRLFGPIFVLTVLSLSSNASAEMSSHKKNLLQVMDLMVQTYGATDWSAVRNIFQSGQDAGPNAPVPLIALGHAWLLRNATTGNARYAAAAIETFEFSAAAHRNWGMRWASPATSAFLVTGAYLAKLGAASSGDPSLQSRAEALWRQLEVITTAEADSRLCDRYPYQPYVSGTPEDGDTKAEENAMVAYLLAMASQMFPGNANAVRWDEKARLLASSSIVRSSDRMEINGSPLVTIEEDFLLWNHGVKGNPYYAVGTVVLLRLGALSYRLVGNPFADEFEQNLVPLYGKYRAECSKDASGRWLWTIPADPVGDPTLMPVPGMGDGAFERSVVAQKAADGYLWQPTSPVKKVIPNQSDFSNNGWGMAVQNGKVVWYYLLDYLWNFPPQFEKEMPVASPAGGDR